MDTAWFKIYICFWLAVFGLCIGSFLNVIIYRIPRKIFFERSRSYCPACNNQLTWADMLPMVSYVILKGRCRFCKQHISLRYPIIELACGVIALLCFYIFGFNPQLFLSFGVITILLAIAVIDFYTMEIPDSLTIALIPFAVLSIWSFADISIIERAIGFFIVSTPMLGLAIIISGAFGGGDIKLISVCGFLLGWQNTLLAFFISLLFGGSYAIWLLVTNKANKGQHIAFGPYLCFGVAVALLWGSDIISFYLKMFF